MNQTIPKTLEEAVTFGLKLLSDRSKRELANIGWVDPHTKYDVDYIAIIGVGLGIADQTNQQLLRDIAANHADSLHFLETDGTTVEPDAAIRVVLGAMSKAASL